MNRTNKILVVDDEASLVELCEFVFKADGHEVRGAFNGPQALNMITEEMPDLILLDVMMPGLTGIEVCHQIRAQYPAQRPTILMYTADDSDETRANSMAAGADDFIPKETPVFELSAKVNTYLSS